MTCICCKSEMTETTTTYVKEFGNSVVVVRHVPCYKCSECGEIHYTMDVLLKVEAIVDKLKETLTEVAIVNYSVA